MHLVIWAEGLLCQLLIFLTPSRELRLHPKQGTVLAHLYRTVAEYVHMLRIGEH